jgi:imidazole glycerol phosphate synthase subunit HisF
VAWVFEYIYQCKSYGAPCIILKLDFEKAFDTIEHEALLQVLKYKGFNEQWINWVREFLSFGSSSVLLNGVPNVK